MSNEQYREIMDLMNKYREKIDRGEHCSHMSMN